MYTFIVILHVFVCLFLILVVLLQRGKGSDMGAAFGGAGSTLFGTRGKATFIQKLTAVMALLFMALSVALASLSSQLGSDLEEEELPPPGQEAGMVPAPSDTGTGTAPVKPEAVPVPAPAPVSEPAPKPEAPAPQPDKNP